MDKRTKKMANLNEQIRANIEKQRELNEKINELDKYKVQTAPGQKAREDAISRMTNEVQELTSTRQALDAQLEVATVEMLDGTDTDFAEPTPAEALQQAS